MSRDFILVFSGGMVSLVTTLIVLFVADYMYRRRRTQPLEDVPPPETMKPDSTQAAQENKT
jgi:hypothetical protein